MGKKKLWMRKLSCGHERPTNIAFIIGKYKKPKVGDNCYCRECCNDVKIVGVVESPEEEKEYLEEISSKTQKTKEDKNGR